MAPECTVPQPFVTAGSQDQLFLAGSVREWAIYSVNRQPKVTFLTRARLLESRRAGPYSRPVRSKDYGSDVLAAPVRRATPAPTVAAEPDLVVEERSTGWCGAVVEADRHAVTLEDRKGRRRTFPYEPAAFLLGG